MKRPTELIEKAKGFKSTDPIRVLAEYAVSLESPRKTVSDAVDFFDGVWPDIIEMPDADGWWFNGEREMCWASYTNGAWILDVVCTREQFEAEVERRKGEEWTHVRSNGELCNVLYEDEKVQLIRGECGTTAIWARERYATKRKPPITHKEIIEMMERVPFVNWTVKDFIKHIHDDFDVV